MQETGEKEKINEEASEKKAEERKEKMKNWLKEPSNIAILAIMILAIVLRLYYFFIAKNQALWWDEAAYGSVAKALLNPALMESPILAREFIIRPLFLPLLWSVFIRFGFAEQFIKFIIILIPSVLSVFFAYLIAKETLNKRAALISALIFSVLWIHLFYSLRMLTDVPALFFSLASIYFFIKAYKQDFEFKPFFWSIFLLSLSIMMRFPFALVGFVYILFIIFTARFNAFKKKSFWLGGILGLIPLLAFFIYNTIKTGFFFPALRDVSSTSTATKFAFYTINFIPHILQKILSVFFIAGLVLCIAELALGFGTIRKNKKLGSHLFMLFILAITLAFFVFVIKAAEDRYLFVGMISFIYLTAISLDYLYTFIKKYNKAIAIIALVLILAFGSYQQFKYGDAMIKDKSQSYAQMKEAFSWIKENSGPSDIVMSYGELYSVYYAERNVYSIPANETEIESHLSRVKPAFFVLSAYFPHQPYVDAYIQQHSNIFKPEKVVYLNEQPVVVVYRIQYK